MKPYLILICSIISISSFTQNKRDYIYYNKLTELKGSEFVIATVKNWGKIETKNMYLLFINTVSGQTKQFHFHKDAYLEKIEQVKIDSLSINKVIVKANTRIIVLSPDGQERIQITEDSYFVRTWAVSNQTGTIVIAGHYDSNNNSKYDKTDKHEIVFKYPGDQIV